MKLMPEMSITTRVLCVVAGMAFSYVAVVAGLSGFIVKATARATQAAATVCVLVGALAACPLLVRMIMLLLRRGKQRKN